MPVHRPSDRYGYNVVVERLFSLLKLFLVCYTITPYFVSFAILLQHKESRIRNYKHVMLVNICYTNKSY